MTAIFFTIYLLLHMHGFANVIVVTNYQEKNRQLLAYHFILQPICQSILPRQALLNNPLVHCYLVRCTSRSQTIIKLAPLLLLIPICLRIMTNV